MKATILAALVFMALQGHANATNLPPVNTNIINAPKAQFIGSEVIGNPDKLNLIPVVANAINPQFKDCNACSTWLEDAIAASTGMVAKFTNATLQTSWTKTGLIGYVGKCVDSTTGNSCNVPE